MEMVCEMHFVKKANQHWIIMDHWIGCRISVHRKEASINHVDMEGVSEMSILLHKTCFEKWSTKGVKNIQKKLSTWFMDDPLWDILGSFDPLPFCGQFY